MDFPRRANIKGTAHAACMLRPQTRISFFEALGMSDKIRRESLCKQMKKNRRATNIGSGK